MLYLLTFLSLVFTTSLASSPISSHGKEDFVKNHPLAKFHTKLQSSSKRMIANSEQGNSYVLSNSFANKDCNSDGGQLFESMAMLSGYCMVSGTTSQRWTCDSSTVHIEEFDAADCLESHRSVDTYVNVGQCFSTSINDTTPNYGVSYDCSSSYVPKGSWFTSMYFTDKACKNALQGVSMLNGYCFSADLKTSFKYDYPKENFYFKSTDCTGAATSIDISSTMNSCLPLTSTVGSANSYETLYVKN